MEFVDILKDIMIDFDLNQTQLAQKIGVKQSQVSEWLKGKNKPNYDTIKKICVSLCISSERVLGLDLI